MDAWVKRKIRAIVTDPPVMRRGEMSRYDKMISLAAGLKNSLARLTRERRVHASKTVAVRHRDLEGMMHDIADEHRTLATAPDAQQTVARRMAGRRLNH
jgi:hypothetical protein